MITGLGKNKSPFLYLDKYVPAVDWNELHTDICEGIARSTWDKKFVSSGVHTRWEGSEITPFIKNKEKYLTPRQIEIFENLPSTEAKLKFMTCVYPIPHPFWSVYLKTNKRIERSGIKNKAVGADCYWTENAQYFPSLIKLIEQMPFAEVGRVMLFMTEANNQTVPHYDASSEQQRQEKPNDDFIWFTTASTTKKIFVYDEDIDQKIYTNNDKKFIWFNEMDFHGTEAVPYFSFSVRIDGKFNSDVKENICNDNN